MMLHSAIHWLEQFDVSLWPFAVEYACWIWNHTPKPDGGLASIEIFSGARISLKYLNSARIWGCPAYVLHPTLQDDKKLPKGSSFQMRKVYQILSGTRIDSRFNFELADWSSYAAVSRRL